MTPILQTVTQPEVAFNECHSHARNVVELCNGRLKNKFRCLHRHRCLHYSPMNAAKIILASCTLYNMFADSLNDQDNNDYSSANEGIEPNLLVYDEEPQDFLAEARSIREECIQTYFT